MRGVVCGIGGSNPPQLEEYTALIKFLERKARLLERKRDLVRSEIKKQIRGQNDCCESGEIPRS